VVAPKNCRATRADQVEPVLGNLVGRIAVVVVAAHGRQLVVRDMRRRPNRHDVHQRTGDRAVRRGILCLRPTVADEGGRPTLREPALLVDAEWVDEPSLGWLFGILAAQLHAAAVDRSHRHDARQVPGR